MTERKARAPGAAEGTEVSGEGPGPKGARPCLQKPVPEGLSPEHRRRHRRRRVRSGIWLLLSLPFALATLVFVWAATTHHPVPLPRWALVLIEDRANAALSGRLRVALPGKGDLVIGAGLMPRVDLHMVQVMQPSGLPIAVLPGLSAEFWPEPLMRGRVVPRDFRITGATVALRRLSDGRLDIDLGGVGTLSGIDIRNIGQLTRAVESVFATPALNALTGITADDLRIRLDDARLNRVWQVSDGRFHLTQDPKTIALLLSFGIGERGAKPAQVALTASTSKLGPEAELGAAVSDLPSGDLAVQSPALSLLGLVDAPISGTFRTGVDKRGGLERLEATLNLGTGVLRPSEGAAAIPFDRAKIRMSYDSENRRVDVSDASVASPALRFRSSARIYLRDFAGDMPREALAQVALRDIEADPEGVFAEPARFSFGALDLRLRTDPFRVDLGQVQLIDDGTRISGKGRMSAGPEGWRVAFDAGINRIGRRDLLALWPTQLVPNTRNWIGENISTGTLRNVHAALRLIPGEEPRFELGYEFQGTQATVLRTLPPIDDGRGFATVFDNRHALMVEKGHVIAPSGGRVEVDGSRMVVPDIRDKPARAEVQLLSRSSIPAALSLLDKPPFELMKKAGKSPDMASGEAFAQTDLDFPLENKIEGDQVDYRVHARLSDVRSDALVKGHVLTSPLLTLDADRKKLEIGGRGKLDSVPFDGSWTQRMGKAEAGHSRVEGYAQVSAENLRDLGIRLPAEEVTGTGWGKISVDLHKGGMDRYAFETDLRGVGLDLPDIGWSKPAVMQGSFSVSGALGDPPTVEKMALSAPGLSASGKLDLAKGGLRRAELSRLKIGRWFSGRAVLTPRGEGRPPDVQVSGGTLDLRHMPEKHGSGRAGNGVAEKQSGRLSGRLDRLVVDDALSLTGVEGNFITGAGVAGAFSGRVNGAAAISGTLAPVASGRSEIRIDSADAGAVAGALGLGDGAEGGRMRMTLSPVGEKSYSGHLQVSGLRVTKAPAYASALNVASLVGLPDELSGKGIVFDNLDGAFRLTPVGLSITRAAAEGAAMAVTVAGNYFPKTGRIDMEGVVSPFYIVNGVGQLVSRRGEGLFGLTYTLTGTASAPQFALNPLSILTPGILRDLFRHRPQALETK